MHASKPTKETHGDAVSYYQDRQHPVNSFDLTPVNWAEVVGVAAVAARL